MSRRRIDGKKLQYLRDQMWMSQKELAELAGVAEHTVNRLENEHTPYPHRNTVLRLARALDVDPNELVRPESGATPLGGSLTHRRRFPNQMKARLTG